MIKQSITQATRTFTCCQTSPGGKFLVKINKSDVKDFDQAEKILYGNDSLGWFVPMEEFLVAEEAVAAPRGE